jgi:hypothetical protein
LKLRIVYFLKKKGENILITLNTLKYKV